MQISFLFVFTGLILIGYLFEIISPKTRIPNILILLGLGMLSQQLVETFHWQKPNFDKLLPELGTVGLILIVLEGTLELNLTRSKIPEKNSFIGFFLHCFAESYIWCLFFLSRISNKTKHFERPAIDDNIQRYCHTHS